MMFFLFDQLAGGFGLNFFVSGGMRSTGLLFIEVIDLYKADKGLTSLTMGLLAFGFAVFCESNLAYVSMPYSAVASVVDFRLHFQNEQRVGSELLADGS
jgi:hypothetical protein